MKVTLPDLGEGIERATVACWHYQEGDCITKDDDIVELVTDKAAFNIPANESGILKQIIVKEGEDVSVGDTLALIEQ